MGAESRGVLWRHADFRRLWTGETLSQLGAHISILALPLVAITTLNATTFQVGLLVALESLAFLLIGLPAGAWCDRMRRRPVLISADLTRAALLASIPLAAVVDRLTLGHLYAVVFFHGVCTVFFDVSYQSYLPSLVGREHLGEGNGKLEASRTVAQASGPTLGGYLVQWLTAPGALAVDAVTYLWSAAWLSRIRTVEPVPERAGRAPLRREIADGLRFVLGHPILRAIAVTGSTAVLFLSAQQAVLLPFLIREVGLTPGAVGVLFTVGSVGAIVGALVTTRLTRWFGQARAMIIYIGVAGLAGLLIPLTGPGARLAFFAVAQALVGMTVIAYNIAQLTYRQTICPDRMLGRMNATMRFVMWGMTPVGGIIGGAVGTAVGLRATLWITSIGLVLPVLWLILSPLGPAALRTARDQRGAVPGAADTASEQVGGLGELADRDESQQVGSGQ
jgi:MFS family permease